MGISVSGSLTDIVTEFSKKNFLQSCKVTSKLCKHFFEKEYLWTQALESYASLGKLQEF